MNDKGKITMSAAGHVIDIVFKRSEEDGSIYDALQFNFLTKTKRGKIQTTYLLSDEELKTRRDMPERDYFIE